MSTPITIRFKLQGQDADLMRHLQRWIRDNDYPAHRGEDGQMVPAGPALDLPWEPDAIVKQFFLNFLYKSVRLDDQENTSGTSQTEAVPQPDVHAGEAPSSSAALLEPATGSSDTATS